MSEDVKAAYSQWKRVMSRRYGDKYYNRHRVKHHEWEKAIIRTLVDQYAIKSLVDFGCGIASYLEGAFEKGVTIKGFEFNLADAMPYISPHIAQFVEKKDVAKPINCGVFDCAMSIEVAEHLPNSLATSKQLVRNLVVASKRYIFFTAASPQQTNPRHINCREYEEWVELFEAEGVRLLSSEVVKMKKIWEDIKHPAYIDKNLMIFGRPSSISFVPLL